MIKKIEIKGFQSHVNSSLDLNPGVNVIIGKSNSGKSAIVRAVNWTVKNRPLGSRFVNLSGSEASVLVQSTDSAVLRERGKKKNQYTIIKGGKDDLELTKLDGDVPLQVSESLGIGDVNLQSQFSPYFLVFDSPGLVAEYLRKLTKTDKIDRISDVLSKRQRSVKLDFKSVTSQLNEVTNNLEVLKSIDLDRLGVLIREARTLIDKMKELGSKADTLMSIVGDIEELKSVDIRLPGNVNSVLESPLVPVSEFGALVYKISGIENVIESIKRISDVEIDIPDGTLKRVDLANSEITNYESTESKISELKSMVVKIETLDSDGKKLESEELDIERENNRLMPLLKECPTCGQSLDEERLKEYVVKNC